MQLFSTSPTPKAAVLQCGRCGARSEVPPCHGEWVAHPKYDDTHLTCSDRAECGNTLRIPSCSRCNLPLSLARV